MLYEDPESRLIVPDDVEETYLQDCASAEAVVWAGISFKQSASVQYFKHVRSRAPHLFHVLVNPCDDAEFNLTSAVANAAELDICAALCSADDFFPQWADAAFRVM
jgi:hypothetical protein